MALLMLLYFIKIGAFTFGSGWSIIAQMEREFVDERGWMTKSDLLELIAVGKSLPGIMVANITLLFGYQMAGVLGGICAAIGLCIPAVVTLTIVTAIYDALKITTGSGRPQGRPVRRGPHHRRRGHLPRQRCSDQRDAHHHLCRRFVLCYFTSIGNLTLVVAGVVIALVWMGVSEHGHV